MFDQLTIEKLDFYVYALINPNDNKPFYIGKGIGNRVFNHQNCAIKDEHSNLKLDTIREIISSGLEVEHIIIRHGLNEKEAFEIEASIIDFGIKFGFEFSNFGIQLIDFLFLFSSNVIHLFAHFINNNHLEKK